MTSKDAYVTFLNLANKLNSADDVNIDIARFVLLYNKNAKIWLGQRVRVDKATQKIDELQQLIKVDAPLIKMASDDQSVSFKLPDDWFDHIGGYALCDQGPCKNKIINSDQVKNEEKRLVLFDENWRPDFDFEWLPITVGQNNIQVFYKDFIINKFVCDYYKYPVDIDIEGYIKSDDVTASTTIDPDLDDMYVNEIIDLTVADVSRIYQNNEKLQLDINRIQQEQNK